MLGLFCLPSFVYFLLVNWLFFPKLMHCNKCTYSSEVDVDMRNCLFNEEQQPIESTLGIVTLRNVRIEFIELCSDWISSWPEIQIELSITVNANLSSCLQNLAQPFKFGRNFRRLEFIQSSQVSEKLTEETIRNLFSGLQGRCLETLRLSHGGSSVRSLIDGVCVTGVLNLRGNPVRRIDYHDFDGYNLQNVDVIDLSTEKLCILVLGAFRNANASVVVRFWTKIGPFSFNYSEWFGTYSTGAVWNFDGDCIHNDFAFRPENCDVKNKIIGSMHLVLPNPGKLCKLNRLMKTAKTDEDYASSGRPYRILRPALFTTARPTSSSATFDTNVASNVANADLNDDNSLQGLAIILAFALFVTGIFSTFFALLCRSNGKSKKVYPKRSLKKRERIRSAPQFTARRSVRKVQADKRKSVETVQASCHAELSYLPWSAYRNLGTISISNSYEHALLNNYCVAETEEVAKQTALNEHRNWCLFMANQECQQLADVTQTD